MEKNGNRMKKAEQKTERSQVKVPFQTVLGV